MVVVLTAMVSSPLTKTAKIPSGTVPWMAKSNAIPGAAGKAWAATKLGKGRTGNTELVGGHDVMNPAARVNTAFTPRPVPYGFAAGTCPKANRCWLVWSASVTRIEAATPRFAGSDISPAAPRYAEVPTPSSTDESVRNVFTSVIGKLYSHAATGSAPAALIADVKSLTCSSSS